MTMIDFVLGRDILCSFDSGGLSMHRRLLFVYFGVLYQHPLCGFPSVIVLTGRSIIPP